MPLGKNFARPQIFSLEISGPKVILLCKFSLYRAARGPGPEASASPASWMIRPWIFLCFLLFFSHVLSKHQPSAHPTFLLHVSLTSQTDCTTPFNRLPRLRHICIPYRVIRTLAEVSHDPAIASSCASVLHLHRFFLSTISEPHGTNTRTSNYVCLQLHSALYFMNVCLFVYRLSDFIEAVTWVGHDEP